MPIETTFYINLDTDYKRRAKFMGKGYHRWSAVDRTEVHEDLDKKMVSMHNFPRKSHLARCGCFASHVTLYQYIVENQLNDCLILEDDAVKVRDLPTEYPDNCITYVGGLFYGLKMMDEMPPDIESVEGINRTKNKFRILMTMSYIIPKWEIAEQILEFIYNRPRARAIDIMLHQVGIPKAYHWPACFVEEGVDSTISKKSKKANEYYKWVNI